jgi:hypothetical protein
MSKVQSSLNSISQQLRSLPLTMDLSLNASASPFGGTRSVSPTPVKDRRSTSSLSYQEADDLDRSHDDPDASMTSALRSTSSRAVLSALRALQSKIHRLEADKSTLKARAVQSWRQVVCVLRVT